ncbi:MAG TPA: tetratricopeptide repeat protein [Terriglobales bacterium]|nr:tetratricopeptide repeat protein [Terriglobales bacterium]
MPKWMKNRLVIGLVVFFTAMGIWESRKPRFRPMYQQGAALYQQQRYLQALQQFDRAYGVDPNQVAVVVMMGWSNLKLRRYEEARFYFQRAQRLDPRNPEAQLGAAFVAWHTGQRLDGNKAQRLAARFPDDPEVRAMAEAAKKQEAGGRR